MAIRRSSSSGVLGQRRNIGRHVLVRKELGFPRSATAVHPSLPSIGKLYRGWDGSRRAYVKVCDYRICTCTASSSLLGSRHGNSIQNPDQNIRRKEEEWRHPLAPLPRPGVLHVHPTPPTGLARKNQPRPTGNGQRATGEELSLPRTSPGTSTRYSAGQAGPTRDPDWAGPCHASCKVPGTHVAQAGGERYRVQVRGCAAHTLSRTPGPRPRSSGPTRCLRNLAFPVNIPDSLFFFFLFLLF